MNLTDLAAAVRSGRTSATELVELSLGRIERLNPPLNAVIRVRERGGGRRAGDGRAGRRRATTPVRSPACPCW